MELLLIDDEATIGPMLEDLLKHDDPNTHLLQVLTCDEGLELIKQRRFDCVILDHGLAHKNGLECLSFIRQMNPQLPVVVVTGDTTDELKVQYENAGADRYIVKPFLSQLFGPIVKAAIEQRKKICDVFAKRDRMLSQLKDAV